MIDQPRREDSAARRLWDAFAHPGRRTRRQITRRPRRGPRLRAALPDHRRVPALPGAERGDPPGHPLRNAKVRSLYRDGHQNYSQTSQRLRRALQNAGIEVAFKEGRDDAEHSARILGRSSTSRIKHEVADPDRAERMHPVFDPIAEQRENFIQELTDLHRGHAYIRLPEWRRRVPWSAAATTTRCTCAPGMSLPGPGPAATARCRRGVLQRSFVHRADLVQRDGFQEDTDRAKWRTQLTQRNALLKTDARFCILSRVYARTRETNGADQSHRASTHFT